MHRPAFLQNLSPVQIALLGGGLLIVLILLLALLSSIFGGVDKDSYLIEQEGMAKEHWKHRLEFDVRRNLVTLTSPYDGYAVTVPEVWQIPQEASADGSLALFYSPEGPVQYGQDIEAHEGTLVSISISLHANPQGKDSVSWLSESGLARFVSAEPASLAGRDGARATAPVLEFDPLTEETRIAKNALGIYYAISRDKTVYVVTCGAVGPAYAAQLRFCEGYLETFKIL